MTTPATTNVPVVPNPPTAPTTTKTGKAPKLPVPDVFDGSRDKYKEWKRQIALYAMVRKADFQDDEEKIAWVIGLMKGGTAGPLADNFVDELIDPSKPTPDYLSDWKKFMTKMDEMFKEADEQGKALQKLKALKQGSKTADEFFAEFKTWAAATKFNDEALIDRLKEGLNGPLLDSIYHLNKLPTTLDEWYTEASRLDRQWRDREAMKGRSSSGRPQRREKGGFTGYRRADNQPSTSHAPQIKQEAARMRPQHRDLSNVTCFNCRRTGHYAKDCRERKTINEMSYTEIRAMIEKHIEEDFHRGGH
jgi:Retrotransposon gag protein/Zinc knuckle